MSTPEHITQILSWPVETWSEREQQQVREHRALLHSQLFTLVDMAERDGRNLTPEEGEEFQRMQAEYDRLGGAVPAQR